MKYTHHKNLGIGVMVSKWINVYKTIWGFSINLTLFDKINFYAGRRDSWGIGIDVSFYDRSITFEIFNLYMGVEVWYSTDGITEFVPKTKDDLLD